MYVLLAFAAYVWLEARRPPHGMVGGPAPAPSVGGGLGGWGWGLVIESHVFCLPTPYALFIENRTFCWHTP